MRLTIAGIESKATLKAHSARVSSFTNKAQVLTEPELKHRYVASRDAFSAF